MNRLKKFTITGLSILLLFTSCSKQYDTEKPDKKDMNVSQISENGFEYRIDSDKLLDPDKVICERLIDKYNDGFVFIGQSLCNDPDFVTVSGKISDDTVTTESFNPDTSLNDCISIKKKENNVYLLNGKNGEGTVSVLDSNNTLIKTSNLEYYPSDIEIREKIYILDSNERKINVYSDTLELEKSIDLTYRENGIIMVPYNITISPSGEIYCLLSDKTDSDSVKIIQAGDTNQVICDSIDDLDKVSDIFTDSNGNIIITEKANNKLLVDIVDKNGDIVTMTEIKNCDEVYGITDNDKIIFSNAEGISLFDYDKEELIIDAGDLGEKNIYTCSVEKDECTVFLFDTLENYNAVFLADKNYEIISEIKADSIDDCFVLDGKIYISGVFDNESTVKVFDSGAVSDTGIILDDSRSKYSIGAYPSGDLLLSTYDKKTLYIYNESFELKNTKNVNINIDGFLYSNDSLYCYDSKYIYRIGEDYNLEIVNTGFDENALFAHGNENYDFILSVSNGVYGINIENKSSTLLINYSKEIVSNIWSLVIMNDQKILFGSLFNIYEAKLEEITLEDYSEKQNLVFAYKDIGDEDINNFWKKSVKTFNNQSKKYQIEMKRYKTDENSVAESLFEFDVISGKIPDIVSTDLLSDSIVTLLKDDSLVDMYSYLKNDDELNREKLYPSVLEAYTYNNKLYSIPIIFWIGTGLMYDGYNENVSNCEQLIDLIVNGYDSQNNFVDSPYAAILIRLYLSEHIDNDYNSLEVSEDDIKKIVSFLRNYVPETALIEFRFSDKNRICQKWDFKSIRDYYYFKTNFDINYPESNAELGCPGSNGVLYSRACISVMNSCKDKDEAWNFIKTCTKCIEKNTEEELYAIKDLNILQDESNDIKENFNLFMGGSFINSELYNRLTLMIYDELRENPDVSDEEVSRAIYNKMKLFFSEIK